MIEDFVKNMPTVQAVPLASHQDSLTMEKISQNEYEARLAYKRL